MLGFLDRFREALPYAELRRLDLDWPEITIQRRTEEQA
jgi:hypothetical protein